MNTAQSETSYTSFLGTGWSYPPEFVPETGEVLMISDEEDIEASLKILLGTAVGERFLNPKYGLDLQEMLFEPMSTTMTTLLKDRARIALLIYESRINLLSLELDTSAQLEGRVSIVVDYQVTATNSRFNLVYPFYLSDASEVRPRLGAGTS
jgi:phage baseplate assembly protein W